MNTNYETETNQPISYEMDWFINNPTYISAEKTPSWSAHDSEGALQIVWNRELKGPEVSRLPERLSDSNTVNRLYLQAATMQEMLDSHKYFAQRETYHPTKYNLVQKRLPGDHYSQTATVPRSRWLYVSFGMVDYPEWENGTLPFGWFEESANPEKFGTLFIYCTVALDNPDDYYGGPKHIRWCLGQVGRNRTELDSVRWDDESGVLRLVNQVTNGDPETYLTMAALTEEASALLGEKRRQDQREATLLSRDAFSRPRDRVKPRVLSAELEGAYWASSVFWRENMANNRYVREVEVHSLNSREIFGYGPRETPVNGAVSMRFRQFSRAPWQTSPNGQAAPDLKKFAPEDFDPFANTLLAVLKVNRLGNLLRVEEDSGVAFYVVKNTELVMAFAPAFGIHRDYKVDLYDWKSESWTPVENK